MCYPLHNGTSPRAPLFTNPGVYAWGSSHPRPLKGAEREKGILERPQSPGVNAWASEKTLNTCVEQRGQRPGFTLIEMLITITIIGILAGGVLAALQSARETAKAAKTKATITKLHYIIMARYDEYRTRRVPINVSHPDLRVIALARLNAIRDLMRMEMPDRWSDVDRNFGTVNPPQVELPLSGLTAVPSITNRFFRLYNEAVTRAGADKVATHAPAECLYMIVMSIPEAAEQFQATEIGDVDGDGLKEFIDGWGHPIIFIRWPAGFVNYENLVLLNGGGVSGPAGQAGEDPLEWSSPSDLQSGDRQIEPDPFDSMRIGGGFTVRLLAPQIGAGYSLFPLIYSAGPDGIFDININGPQPVHAPDQPVAGYINPFWRLDPYVPLERTAADNAGNKLVYLGQPIDSDAIDGTSKNGALNHYDNIHNHMLEVR